MEPFPAAVLLLHAGQKGAYFFAGLFNLRFFDLSLALGTLHTPPPPFSHILLWVFLHRQLTAIDLKIAYSRLLAITVEKKRKRDREKSSDWTPLFNI
jgi:hypothetical protein